MPLCNLATMRYFHVAILLIFVFLIKGSPVPDGNENHYLLRMAKEWDASLCAKDWTLSLPASEHFLFNATFGLPARFVSLKTLGWAGRILCWSLSLMALIRIGRRFQISGWMVTLSIGLWLLYGQSLVAGEWIFGGFEAKSVAYIFLLFALDGFLGQGKIVPAMLLGVCFSFHPAVGMWGILATGFALIGLRVPISSLLTTGALTALFALPALIPLLPTLMGDQTPKANDWELMVIFKMPWHLDPLSWVKRDILQLYILMAFSWIYSKAHKENRTLQFLAFFEIFLCLVFSVGIVLRVTGQFEWLKFMPFRLFPLFSPLFFFFRLMHAYRFKTANSLGHTGMMLGLVALLGFSNPVGKFFDHVSLNVRQWKESESKDDLKSVFVWISEHTPKDAIIIAPPWRKDTWFLTRRAQIVSYSYHPYDAQKAWRERVESLVGNRWRKEQKTSESSKIKEMEDNYAKLTEETVLSIAKRYGGDYFVSQSPYSFPVSFEVGMYKVYALSLEEQEIQ